MSTELTGTTALSKLVATKPNLALWVEANAQFDATVRQEATTTQPSTTIDELLKNLELKKGQFFNTPLQAQPTDNSATHGRTAPQPIRPGALSFDTLTLGVSRTDVANLVGEGVYFTTTGNRNLAESVAQTLYLKTATIDPKSPKSGERILLQSILAFLSDATIDRLKAINENFLKRRPISEQDALLITAIHTLHASFERISRLPDIAPVKDSPAETTTRNYFHALALSRHTLTELDAIISGGSVAAKDIGGNPRARLMSLTRR